MTTKKEKEERLKKLREKLGAAQESEESMTEETKAMMLAPTKGKGINKHTYLYRQGILEEETAKKVYQENLPHTHMQFLELVTRARHAFDNSKDWANARTLGRSERDPYARWNHLSTHMCMYHNPTVEFLGMMMLYAAYEKDIDDYVRAQYGFNKLSDLLSPAFQKFMRQKVQSIGGGALKILLTAIEKIGVPEEKLNELKEMLAEMGDEEVELGHDGKPVTEEDYTYLEMNIVKEGLRIVSELAMVKAGVYKDVFGHDVPYMAPYSVKAMKELETKLDAASTNNKE